MTRPRGVDAQGNDVDLIGQRIEPGMGSTPGVLVAREEGGQSMATKRTYQLYRWQGTYIQVFDGDNVPEGAEKVEPEARAKVAAPENKAKATAPETKSRSTKKAEG